MATALQSVRFAARSCSCTQLARQNSPRSIASRRVFSTTPSRWKKKVDAQAEAAVIEKAGNALGINLKRLEADSAEALKELEEYLDAEIDFGPAPFDVDQGRKKLKETFLNMGEQEPFEDGEFKEDEEDDISTLAHRELEQHREWRHYARLAAWEMPLLSKLAKPFEMPTGDMALRFRYTTYMGEHHPAEKKVVVEFSPADMPNLTSQQRDKFRKLLGVRYNPEKDTVRMSCEMFEAQVQNKRYLGDLVDTLLHEARDPTDTFEDVPLDTRHHHFKPKLRFPKEWAMTDDRRRELAGHRHALVMKDEQRQIAGELIDGVKKIQEALARPKSADDMADMVMVGKSTKGKRVAVRR